MQNMTKITGKMTLTINSEIYSQLLSQYQPRIIKTEEENEYFLEVVEELLSCKNLTNEENLLLELLVKLIEDFEKDNYSLNVSTPHSRLLHLMEAQNLEKSDLINIFDSITIVDKVLNKELKITQEQAQKLGTLLNVDASLFV